MAEPAKTFAIVVGVEKYDYGANWNLLGPAADAISFVRWLQGRNVPLDNIKLFLSPLQDPAEKDLEWQEAMYHLIDDCVMKWLPDQKEKSELLYFFWGGHGVVTERDERRLYCADATPDNKQNADFNSLLTWLRSSKYLHFKQQVFFIDTCANYFEEMRLPVGLRHHKYPDALQEPDIKQFSLFAAGPGELTENIRNTGVFSKTVLEVLAKYSGNLWPPDMSESSETLRKRCSGSVYLACEDWKTNKWKEGAPPHGDRLATSLTPLLDKLPLGFRELLQVYYASVPDTQTAPRPNSREEMIDFLSHMIPRPDSLPPLFIFVERLAQQLSNQQLSEWVNTHAERPKVEDLQRKLVDEAKKEPWNCLVIEISSKEPAVVDAYYWDALEQRWSEHMMESCAPPTLETVRTVLPKIFEKVEAMCRGRLMVELLLPRKLLCEDLHDWEIPFEPESEILGRRSPVLVRSRDRLRNFKEIDRDRWRCLSQRIKGRLQQRTGSVEWLDRDHDLSKVRTALDRHDSGEYISLRFEPPRQQTKPMDALSSG